jgi:demethylmenaquinone methyltransferase/2-methoxy-6-polyprenyl-1,4-benzoquinol methylase
MSLPRKEDTPAVFSRIADRYDLLNHVLSFNIDRTWRRRLVESATLPSGGRVLDACTGTGDVAFGFVSHSEPSVVCGVDLSREMLRIGRGKSLRKRLADKVVFVEGDVLGLPFESGVFNAVTIAWGLRNLPDYRAGILEMTRVLDTGGTLLVLEFAPPKGNVLLEAYGLYLRGVVPFLGGLVSGSRQAYRYLASSIGDFLPRNHVLELMDKAGLKNITAEKLTGGIAYIYRGEK